MVDIKTVGRPWRAPLITLFRLSVVVGQGQQLALGQLWLALRGKGTAAAVRRLY